MSRDHQMTGGTAPRFSMVPLLSLACHFGTPSILHTLEKHGTHDLHMLGLEYVNFTRDSVGRFSKLPLLQRAGSWLSWLRLRAGSDYAQVGRSVNLLDQTMSRGEAFGLKKYFKNNSLSYFEYFNGKKVWPLDGSLGRAFWWKWTLLERPNSWRHNFPKVLPLRLFWRWHPLDFDL